MVSFYKFQLNILIWHNFPHLLKKKIPCFILFIHVLKPLGEKLKLGRQEKEEEKGRISRIVLFCRIFWYPIRHHWTYSLS